MTTINTIEDLVRLLDEKAEWAEALRSRLLSRELVELPERFARFQKQMDEFQAVVLQSVSDLVKTVHVLSQAVQANSDRLGKIESDLGGLRSDVKRIQVDMGPLRASHARNAALEDPGHIAELTDCQFVKVLTKPEIRALTKAIDTSGILANEMESFRNADIIMEATNAQGEPCYVAVEISFTVSTKDTSRASRNAVLLTQFTGAPAYAGVVGVGVHDLAEARSDPEDVFIYRLPEKHMTVD